MIRHGSQERHVVGSCFCVTTIALRCLPFLPIMVLNTSQSFALPLQILTAYYCIGIKLTRLL